MAWKHGLTGKALRIAEIDCKNLRVMAGPGTGKTFAMKRRVARLLEDRIDPDRILVVTFTRLAASSLINELAQLGEKGCDKIQASTLHSFCFGVLGRQDVFRFSGRVPRPLVTFLDKKVFQFEAKPLLQDIAPGAHRKASKQILAFEAAWARLQSEVPGWPSNPADRTFQELLNGWLKFHKSMLVGELVPEALRFLRNNPASPILTAYDHVLVDEYQDLNRADQALVDRLASKNIVIVGDENQSIYRFRHANPEGIQDFENTRKPTQDEKLDVCRRCPTLVVKLANSLIATHYPKAATPVLSPILIILRGKSR